MTFEEWWKKTYQRKPTHGPCCTCQDCGQYYDNDCRCDCKDVAEAAYKEAIKKCRSYMTGHKDDCGILYDYSHGEEPKYEVGYCTCGYWELIK